MNFLDVLVLYYNDNNKDSNKDSNKDNNNNNIYIPFTSPFISHDLTLISSFSNDCNSFNFF